MSDEVKQYKPSEVMHKLTLSYEEVEALTGFSVESIRRAIKDGQLHAVKVGRNNFIKRVDLDAFITSLGQTEKH
jgi:excisionase family DNA binding protein